MRSNVARCHAVFVTLFAVMAIFFQTATAQNTATKDGLKLSEKEAALAKKLQEGTDVAAKLKLAEKFIKDYPKSPVRDQVARYVGGQISTVTDLAQQSALIDSYKKIFTNAGESDFVAPYLIEIYTKSQRHDEAFQLGTDYLSRFPGDVLVSLHLTIEGTNLSRGGNRKFNAQTINIAQKSVDFIEAGKKPAELSDEDWKKAQGVWLGRLYQSLGFISVSEGKEGDAIPYFDKATKIDPQDINSWVMIGYIINEGYQSLARKSQAATGAEQVELRRKAEAELDRVIENYARVVALTDGNAAQAQLNTQIRGDLEKYYKFRHGGSLTGLKEMIEKFKADQ